MCIEETEITVDFNPVCAGQVLQSMCIVRAVCNILFTTMLISILLVMRKEMVAQPPRHIRIFRRNKFTCKDRLRVLFQSTKGVTG